MIPAETNKKKKSFTYSKLDIQKGYYFTMIREFHDKANHLEIRVLTKDILDSKLPVLLAFLPNLAASRKTAHADCTRLAMQTAKDVHMTLENTCRFLFQFPSLLSILCYV